MKVHVVAAEQTRAVVIIDITDNQRLVFDRRCDGGVQATSNPLLGAAPLRPLQVGRAKRRIASARLRRAEYQHVRGRSMTWERDHAWEQASAAQPWPEGVEPPRAYRSGALAALISRDPIDPDGSPGRWHISVQHKTRIPEWREMVRAAHELRPGVVFVIGVPPRSMWINLHPHVLHLWELRDENLIAQWRFEGRGDAPT